VRGDGAVLLRRRPERGLLGGMMEVPSTEWRAARWDRAEALRAAPFAADLAPLPGSVRHGFTHFELELALLAADAPARAAGEGLWWPVERLGEQALPNLMKKVVRHALRQG
jgi:A/G-specific adenine glycosylase